MIFLFILVYFAGISFISFNIILYDKRVAKKLRKRRVNEHAIFLLAILGGSLGIFLAMLVMNHKTRKARFMYGIPLIIIVQVIAISFYLTS